MEPEGHDGERARQDARRELDRHARDLRADLDRRRSRPAPLDRQGWDDTALVAVVPVAAVAALPLLVGHLSAYVFAGGWPRYGLSDVPGVLGRFVQNLGDPGRAWDPVNTGSPVPGPAAWWTTFLFVVVLVTAVSLAVLALGRRETPSRGRGRGETGKAGTRGLARHLRVRRDGGARVVVGAAGRTKLAVRDAHSLLVIGPAHAGKTAAVTVPAVLQWPGLAIVSSTKGHLIDETIGWRSHQGEVHVYDPAAVTRYRKSGWSPLAGCETWAGAIRTARDLTLAAESALAVGRPGADGVFGARRGDLWTSSMAMALAPYLLATAACGQTITATGEWLEREERDQVVDVLRSVDRAAAQAHHTSCLRPDAERSAFLRAMRRVLAVYDDPVVAASMTRHEIVARELLDGGTHTLYVAAPEHDQARYRPLAATVVRQVVAAAYEQSAIAGRALSPPVLLVLDQVVGVAPAADLADLASTGAARGVQLVSVFQDAEEIDAHYGDAAGAVVRNHAARLLVGGPGPGRHARASLAYGDRPPLTVELLPWFDDRDLRRRVATPQALVEPVQRATPVGWWAVGDQAAAWINRGDRDTVHVPDDPTIPIDVTSAEFAGVFGTADAPAEDNVSNIADAWSRARRRK
jgi:hypothetical protein